MEQPIKKKLLPLVNTVTVHGSGIHGVGNESRPILSGVVQPLQFFVAIAAHFGTLSVTLGCLEIHTIQKSPCFQAHRGVNGYVNTPLCYWDSS